MTDKHTREPWQTDGHDIWRQESEPIPIDIIDIGNFATHCGEHDWRLIIDPEDARRIVACVNACVGIGTETLETITGQSPSLCELAIAHFMSLGFVESIEMSVPDDCGVKIDGPHKL